MVRGGRAAGASLTRLRGAHSRVYKKTKLIAAYVGNTLASGLFGSEKRVVEPHSLLWRVVQASDASPCVVELHGDDVLLAEVDV